MKKLRDLDSLEEFKKLLKQEFRSKLSKELKKLPKKFIYTINIDNPYKSRSLEISFHNKKINQYYQVGANTNMGGNPATKGIQ